MPNGTKKVRGTVAASIMLAASLASVPAIATKRPPPPPPTDPDPWAGCTLYGPYIYGLDCCGYPDLVVPCEASPIVEPALRPEKGSTESQGQ